MSDLEVKNVQAINTDHAPEKIDLISKEMKGDDIDIVLPFTEEKKRRVKLKTDLVILPLLCGVFFLQYLDKQSLNCASVFGLITDLKLHRTRYSWYSSIFYVVLFIICGALISVMGVVFYFAMPSGPDKAWFLTPREREVAAMRSAMDYKGEDKTDFSVPQLIEALTDIKSWLVFSFGVLVTMPSLKGTASGTHGLLLILLPACHSENKRRDALGFDDFVSPFDKGADITDGEDLNFRYNC